MSKFVRLTVRSTRLPLVINADLIESMIPMGGYTSIRMTGSVLGSTDHVLESVEQIEEQLLRDEFAKVALSRFCSDKAMSTETAIRLSYEYADAILKERAK